LGEEVLVLTQISIFIASAVSSEVSDCVPLTSSSKGSVALW